MAHKKLSTALEAWIECSCVDHALRTFALNRAVYHAVYVRRRPYHTTSMGRIQYRGTNRLSRSNTGVSVKDRLVHSVPKFAGRPRPGADEMSGEKTNTLLGVVRKAGLLNLEASQ